MPKQQIKIGKSSLLPPNRIAELGEARKWLPAQSKNLLSSMRFLFYSPKNIAKHLTQ